MEKVDFFHCLRVLEIIVSASSSVMPALRVKDLRLIPSNSSMKNTR
jgi:hypothetical protein